MYRLPALLLTVASLTLFANVALADDAGLVGHWKLQGDAQDSSGQGNHGRNHGVVFTGAARDGKSQTAAQFNGRNAWIEVPHSKSLQFGTGDFSLSAWVQTPQNLDDIPGDILSKFDLQSRRGINFGVNQASVTTSQSNTRNVFFGIDNGQSDKEWTDCGRPGNSVFVFALSVYQGELYAGTTEPNADQAGHVFRYTGGERWVDCGSPDKSNSVASLAVYEGRLYAGTAKYRLRGSALSDSENLNLGGKVFRYEGEQRWTDCGQLPNTEAIGGMVVFNGKLYASSLYPPAGFYRYDGGTTWTSCGSPNGKRTDALCIFNGALYATGYDEGHIYRYDGEKWTDLGKLEDSTQTYGFAVHNGQLFVSTWPKANVYRLDDGPKWTFVGRPGTELETMPLMVYNGKMYTGTLPLAEVYRYDGDVNWAKVGRIDLTPDVKYRRVWSMATFQGKLFAGTLPSGRVQSFEAGKNVTSDTELPSAWQHIAAVRSGKQLKLYVNGKLVATSAEFDPQRYDLSNEQPLKIGFGTQDYWNGGLSDVRIYQRGLTAAEVITLSHRP